MKIHWTDACKNGLTPTASTSPRTILTRLSIMCVAWVCVASATTANAQSNAEALQQAGGFSPVTAEVQGGMLQHGDKAYRVVDTASYRTAADAKPTSSNEIQQVGHGASSCSTCGTSTCGGSCGDSCGSINMDISPCGTCGTACGGTGGKCGFGFGSIRNSNHVSKLSCQGALSNNDPCAPCQPYRYASAEALYLYRESRSFNQDFRGNFNLNGTFPLPDFNERFAGRFTMGAVTDCVNGYESSFVAFTDWNVGNSLPGLVTVSEAFSPDFVLPGEATTRTTVSFENQVQNLNTDYYSIDASKTYNGFEMAKLLIGGRYIDYSEDYNYAGTMVTTTEQFPTGIAPPAITVTDTQDIQELSSVENRLVGLQVGLDLLYPIGRFAFSDMRLRAGAYANFAESDFAQQNVRTVATVTDPPSDAPVTDRTDVINSSSGDDDVDIAGLFEFGSGVRYQVGELLSFRVGAEVWYLANVASATDNVTRPNGPIIIDEDVFFAGLTFGSELRW